MGETFGARTFCTSLYKKALRDDYQYIQEQDRQLLDKIKCKAHHNQVMLFLQREIQRYLIIA